MKFRGTIEAPLVDGRVSIPDNYRRAIKNGIYAIGQHRTEQHRYLGFQKMPTIRIVNPFAARSDITDRLEVPVTHQLQLPEASLQYLELAEGDGVVISPAIDAPYSFALWGYDEFVTHINSTTEREMNQLLEDAGVDPLRNALAAAQRQKPRRFFAFWRN
jgi:hypothetical protein